MAELRVVVHKVIPEVLVVELVRVPAVEAEVSKLVVQDVLVEEDQAEMVVHIFHMAVLLDITSAEVGELEVMVIKTKVTDEMVVVEVVQEQIRME
jgi:hypothetical protein